MTVLFLDLATKFGWARGSIGGNNQSVEFGSMTLPKTSDDVGRFLCVYRRWLVREIEEQCVSLVVFEAPILRGKETAIATARKLMGLANVTEMVCIDLRVKCNEVSMSSTRSNLLGYSQAPKHIIGKEKRRKWLKERIVEGCHRHGWMVTNDDEGDACAGLHYVRTKLDKSYAAATAGPLLTEGAA